jgi:hypothetical protein
MPKRDKEITSLIQLSQTIEKMIAENTKLTKPEPIKIKLKK